MRRSGYPGPAHGHPRAVGSGGVGDADTLDGYDSSDFVLVADYTPADILAKLLTVDGAGSGLDADTLDGMSSAAFAPVVHTHDWADITGEPAFAPLVHTHVWADITGTPTTLAGYGITSPLPVAQGGTGNTTNTAAQSTIADAAADTTTFPVLAGAATGDLPLLTDAGLSYNASTNKLTAGAMEIGVATGTSLDLSGGLAIAVTQELAFNGLGAGYRWRQDAFARLMLKGTGGVDAFGFTNTTFFPAFNGTLGSITAGFGSLYLDEAGAGTQTAQIIAPTLSADIVLTTPAATGTLCRTDGDNIGATTAATGRFTTLTRRSGTTGDYVGVGGTWGQDLSSDGNVAGGADTDMQVFSLDAGTLANDGDRLEIHVEVQVLAARYRLIVGSTTLYDTGAGVTAALTVKAQLWRSSATAFVYAVQAFNGTADTVAITGASAGSATWSGTVTIRGVGNGTNAGDATSNYTSIDYKPSN